VPLLLCDMDDTLLDRAGTFQRWVTGFLDQRDAEASHAGWFIEQDRQGRRPRAELFSAAKQRLGLPEAVEDLVAAFYRDFAAMFQLDPAVASALARARRSGWRIAIVSNGTPAQEPKIFASGLDAAVDAWCISGIEGCWKPQVRLLEIAAQRCAVPLAQAWMIGDSPEADIGGAWAAGIPSVWLRHDRAWPLPDFAPTLEADSFPEAVDLVLRRSA
jgi:putative hydrolase of the HAD superfamily